MNSQKTEGHNPSPAGRSGFLVALGRNCNAVLLCALSNAVLAGLALEPKASAQFDIVTKTTPSPGTIHWHIDQPRVNVPMTDYPQIVLSAWDLLQVSGGGCVQTGGKGKTWKSYVNPSGAKSDHLYHGEINLPGVTNGLEWLSSYVGQRVQLPGTVAAGSHLILGYTDDGYSDNNYQNHDNGDNDQCLNIGAAFVDVIVTKESGSVIPMTQVRISGANYLDLARKDSGDGVTSSSGFACVVHNPGCGAIGNDGTDRFFPADSQLPVLAKVAKVEYTPLAVDGHSSEVGGFPIDDAGSYGSYWEQTSPDATQPQLVPVRWHNTCVGANKNVDLYYQISFLISMPVGTRLNETTYPATAEAAPACPVPPTNIAISRLALAPDNGYVNMGQSITISWEVDRCGQNCSVQLQGFDGVSFQNLIFSRAKLDQAGSLTTLQSQKQTMTQYKLTASGSNGNATKTVVASLAPSTQGACTSCSTYYFKISNPDSALGSCFTIGVYAKDAATAMALAVEQAQGESVTAISADQATTACLGN